jgi:hypothetical protein
MSREDKALCALDRKGFGLEIGPSHNPIAPKKLGFNVHMRIPTKLNSNSDDVDRVGKRGA